MKVAKGLLRQGFSAALVLLVVACGGGGGGSEGGGSTVAAFPTVQTDELPQGARIDVSSQNLFQMQQGDVWVYGRTGSGGVLAGTAQRQVTADDGAGHVTLVDDDNGAATYHYVVSADGLLDPAPQGDIPPTMAGIIGGIFEYATPLYPIGAVRRHVRSGPFGEDLDGDGVGESFRYEFTQVFLGFESVQLSPFVTLHDVAHFHNVFQITLRPTVLGLTDYTITAIEDAWFAPNLGMVKAQRSMTDSDGTTLAPAHTLLFSQGTVAGVNWDLSVPPPPPLDGTILDIPLEHNALVYDSVRNVYYASIPGSVVGNGNRIATIEPATGQVSYSAPIGSEPNALAIAADASVLYVGLDGSGEVERFALPLLTPQGKTQLVVDSFFGATHAETIAVSPADPTVVAVSMAYTGVSPSHAGVALLRDMVMQPNRTQTHTGSNLIAFNSSGAKVYGLNNETTEFGLRRIGVLADGLAQELVVPALTNFGTRALSVAGNRVIAGPRLFDAGSLAAAGVISGAGNCWPDRSGATALCVGVPTGTVLVADATTFVIGASPRYASSELNAPARLVQGPSGQVALSYDSVFSTPSIRLFTSTQLP